MIEINHAEPCNFEFEMQITGDATDAPKVYFDLITEGMTLSFEATHLENGLYQVNLPALKKFLNGGSYKCDISVLLGEHLFTPLEDTVNLKEPPKPVINHFTAKQAPKPTTIKIESFQAKQAPKPEPVKAKPEAPVKPAETIIEVKPEPVKPTQPEVEVKPESHLSKDDESLFDMLVKRKKS